MIAMFEGKNIMSMIQTLRLWYKEVSSENALLAKVIHPGAMDAADTQQL